MSPQVILIVQMDHQKFLYLVTAGAVSGAGAGIGSLELYKKCQDIKQKYLLLEHSRLLQLFYGLYDWIGAIWKFMMNLHMPSKYTAGLARRTIDNLVLQLICYSSFASNFNSF